MHQTSYLPPDANEISDALIVMIEAGIVVPVLYEGNICFAHSADLKPDHEIVDRDTAVRHLRQYEESAMGVWN